MRRKSRGGRIGAVRELPLQYDYMISLDLFDFRQKFRISNELSYAVSMIFLKDIILAPSMQASNVDFSTLGANAPGYLER